MNKERISYLRQQFLSRTISSAELAELKEVMLDPTLDKMLLDLAEEVWLTETLGVPHIDAKSSEIIYQEIIASPQKRRSLWPHKIVWPRIVSIAAAILLVLSIGLWFLKTSRHPDLGSVILSLSKGNDLAPGHHGAILTLASGKQIKLSDAANGEIAKEAGIIVTKTADGQLVYNIQASASRNPANTSANTSRHPELVSGSQYNTLTTAKGETYILTLPDKSKVWMNAASSLTYSAALMEHGVRKVKLEGEAYFEVSKDKAHPFIVESKGQQVEVLGTHFNINAYSDEPAIATTLLEGSVRVTYASRHPELVSGPQTSNQNVVLKPGEQALNTGKNIKIEEANMESVTDWKNGEFIFEDDDLRVTMRKIARWYDVEIIYDASAPAVLSPGGWVSRSKNLSAVLEIMEATGKVHFKVEGRRITVSQ